MKLAFHFLLLPLLLSAAAPGGADEARPRISSGFGPRSHPLHGRYALHRGIDLPGREGTPIQAPASGTVRVAGQLGGYGKLVELVHADGSVTRYAHLSRILVRTGEAVTQGQLIGEMGSTGKSTASHLHFEYHRGGKAVDPLPYLTGAQQRARIPGPQRRIAVESGAHRSRFSRARDTRSGAITRTLPNGSNALLSLQNKR